MSRSVPTVGWLAKRIAAFGEPAALGATALGLLVHDLHGQEAAEGVFDDLSGSFTPARDYVGLWREVEAAYPALRGVTEAFYGWAVGAPDTRAMVLTDVALVLRGLDWEATSAAAPAEDLLGALRWEIQRRAGRRRQPFEAAPLRDMVTYLDMTQRRPVKPGEVMTDPSCATGIRAVAFSLFAATFDVEPGQVSYYLADHDPVMLAIAGVNCTCAGITDLHLTVAPYPARPFEVWKGVRFTRLVSEVTESVARITDGVADNVVRSALSFATQSSPSVRDNNDKWLGLTQDGGRLRPLAEHEMTGGHTEASARAWLEEVTIPKAYREQVDRFVANGATLAWAVQAVRHQLDKALEGMAGEMGTVLHLAKAIDTELADPESGFALQERDPTPVDLAYRQRPELYDAADAASRLARKRSKATVRQMQTDRLAALVERNARPVDLDAIVAQLQRLVEEFTELGPMQADLARAAGEAEAAVNATAEAPAPKPKTRRSRKVTKR